MNIDSYKNFEYKSNFVKGTKKIVDSNDIEKIFYQFDKFHSKDKADKLIFRGANESAYKMYNSTQREWITNYQNLSYIDYLKSLCLFDKNRNWTESSTLAYLSIRQHSGKPTFLLDFTYNPFVALYFGCKNEGEYNFNDNFNDVRNFFSIYFIWPEWFTYKDFTRKIEDINLEDFSQDNVYQLEINELVCNNPNILAQEGLFLINTSSKLDLISVLKKEDITEGQKFFGCYNIHKSLAKKIEERLLQKGITHESLFPDLRKIKK
jgi:hypothetical protein